MLSARCELIIVDDHEVVRCGLQRIVSDHDRLRYMGWAEDGNQAVELACRVKPGVVIMDLELPRCDGLAATKQLARLLPATNVVAFSMRRTPAAVLAALSAGVKGFVSKMSANSVLIEAILAAAAGKHFIDPSLANPVILDLLKTHAIDKTTLTLTAREQEVLASVAKGFTNGDIADRIGISTKTVESYKTRACNKLGLKDRPAIVRFALASGWMNDIMGESAGIQNFV